MERRTTDCFAEIKQGSPFLYRASLQKAGLPAATTEPVSPLSQQPIPPITTKPLRIRLNRMRRYALYAGAATAFVTLVAASVWVLPAYTIYRDATACGPSQVCRATVPVGGKSISFLAALHQKTLMIFQLPEDDGQEVKVYVGLTNTVEYTPQLKVEDANGDGLMDLVITSHAVQALPILYQYPDGSFGWVDPSMNGGYHG